MQESLAKETAPQGAKAQTISLAWYGQACFLLSSPDGTRVLIDPIPDNIGYKPKKVEADIVTISHEHFDHVGLDMALGKPAILRGLAQNQKTWQKHDKKFADVRIRNVGLYHDKSQGAQRGLNSAFIFESGGLRLVHMGDQGHLLSEGQIKAIGPVDVLMVPVGGFYTIDADEAREIVNQLKPKMCVIPMHYRTDVLTIKELSSIDAFLKKAQAVERLKGNVFKFDINARPKESKVVVLNYQ